jgi:hypothetical protein
MTNLPPLNSNQEAELLFGDILAYIERAGALADAGDTVALVGLNEAVDALCQRVVGLGEAQSREYTPELEHIMHALDGLQKKLMQQKGEVAAAIKSLNTSRRATHAYIKAPEAEG